MSCDDSWAARARLAVAAELATVSSWRAFSGLWSTARTSYDAVALPPGFVVRLVAAGGGAKRRVAVCAGVTPALVIVPGLFASLQERLFVDIAATAQRRGQSVVLVEDRLAAPTLALNGGRVATTATLARELAAVIVTQLEEPPDVLALSAGAAAALFAPARMRRVVSWSSAVFPKSVFAHASRSALVHRHFARLASRAFSAANVSAPTFAALVDAVDRDARGPLVDAPMLLVHAANDPVAPLADVQCIARELRANQAVCIVARGGHLGFGHKLGADIYLSPLLVASHHSAAGTAAAHHSA